MVAMMAVMIPMLSTSADAQTRNYRSGNYSQRSNNQRIYKKRGVYDKHRNLINIGAGTGIGAIIGAIAGGKKGAAIGALVGGGGAAVYSYGIKPKKKNYYRRNY
jgi:phage tail tape-measure protein